MADSDHSFPGVTQLDGRTLLKFTGPDRLRYLNGQVTNEVAKASMSSAVYACVTDAKGKLQADIYIREFAGESIMVDASAELRDALSVRLERYIIADDVELEDVTCQFTILHLMDERAQNFTHGALLWSGSCLRFGKVGTDIIVSTDEASEVRAALEQEFGTAGSEEIEAARITNGFPIWGKELGEGMLPPEARIEDRAVSYTKGCYIGQEVISRIKSAGKVNRMLCKFRLLEGNAEAGDALFAEKNGDLVQVGEITSVVKSVTETLGLAYAKRGYNEGLEKLKSGKEPEAPGGLVELIV